MKTSHVLGTDDVYIIGRIYEDDVPYAGIAHWDGTDWAITAQVEIQESDAPGADYTEHIIGLAVLGPNDIWTTLNRSGSSRITLRARILRWHNGIWETIETSYGRVASFNGADTKEIYTIIEYTDPNFITMGLDNPKLARYWDGTSWGEISFPVPKGKREPFSGVHIISDTEAWVVGEAYNTPNKHQPYIAHGTSPCAVPDCPSLISPANDQIVQRTDPTLKWNFARGANTFEVSFKRKASTEPTDPVTVRPAKFKPPTPLNRGTEYKWRVRACNNNGCGQWSAANTFIIAEAAP